ncbi:MAG: Ig-like domain-containing protein, partial [Peptoniphilus harei]|nr:Ig-like domain-containing protein [Peptoniphilus harei]
MENLKNIIESKKLKSSDKKPRYATRKLSVGLVSCMLGYFVFMSPTVVNAQAVEGASVAPTSQSESVDEPQKAEVNENSEAASVSVDKEVAEKNTEVEERKEATTNVAVENEENALEKKTKVVANSEEITNKEGAPLVVEDKKDATGDKKAEEEDAEKAAKAVEEKEETVSAKENKDEKEVENKDVATENAGDLEVAAEEKEALGISEEIDPEAQTAEKSKDISNDIINPRVSIRTENTTTPGTLDAGLGEQLTWGLSFTTPEGTKEGDTFTVKLSDNMSLKGLEPDTDYALPVKFGDKIIATAKRIDRQTIQYTFTKDIEEMKYARVYIINSAQENKDVVQNSGDQTFKINVGEKAKAEKDINVDFGKLYHAETSENVNGRSQFTEFNPETGEFTQVFYLNPESKEINTSSTNDQNGREWGKVGFLLSSPHDADKPRSVDYLKDNTKIEVKKLPKGAKLPDAIIENPEGAQKATNVEGGFLNFKGEPMFTMNFGGGNKIDSPYVVVVKGHANKIDGKYTNLYSNGTLYGDGEASLFLDNLYTVQENSTDSEGEKETLGYFKEHHIYITKENGKEISRFKIPGATVSGTADEYYYTDKNEIPGYHFVKIGEGDNAPKNDPAYNENGEIKQGHFEVGKRKEVTYIYENDIKKGSFKETHVYITKDFDGNVVGEPITEPGKSSEGTKDKPYTSAKVDKVGYELVKVTADKGSDEVKISDDKKSVIPGNYVEDKNLSVTYEYVKQPGRFVEHHIYQTVD